MTWLICQNHNSSNLEGIPDLPIVVPNQVVLESNWPKNRLIIKRIFSKHVDKPLQTIFVS